MEAEDEGPSLERAVIHANRPIAIASNVPAGSQERRKERVGREDFFTGLVSHREGEIAGFLGDRLTRVGP